MAHMSQFPFLFSVGFGECDHVSSWGTDMSVCMVVANNIHQCPRAALSLGSLPVSGVFWMSTSASSMCCVAGAQRTRGGPPEDTRIMQKTQEKFGKQRRTELLTREPRPRS